MRHLLAASLFSHTLLAGGHAHECTVPGNATVWRVLIAAAYVILAVIQAIMLYRDLRRQPVAHV